MKELAVCNTPFEMIDLISWWQTNCQVFFILLYIKCQLVDSSCAQVTITFLSPLGGYPLQQ
jgi:hypothetical protein